MPKTPKKQPGKLDDYESAFTNAKKTTEKMQSLLEKEIKDDLDDSLRAIQLMEQATYKGKCRFDSASQEICRLADAKEYKKIKLIAKLSNDLCKKFLCRLHGFTFKQEDIVGNLEYVKKLPQWNEISKYADKAEGFDVKVKKDDSSAEITFKYKDGSSKKLTVHPKEHEVRIDRKKQKQLNLAFAEMFLGKIDPSKFQGEYEGKIPQNMQEKLNLAFAEMFLGKIGKDDEKSGDSKAKNAPKKIEDKKIEDKIKARKKRIKAIYEHLSSPDNMYRQIESLAPLLNRNFIREYSVPLSKFAAIRGKGGGPSDCLPAMKEAAKIIDFYYPDRSKVSDKEKINFIKLGRFFEFGLFLGIEKYLKK